MTVHKQDCSHFSLRSASFGTERRRQSGYSQLRPERL
jgi:hypothetical protein